MSLETQLYTISKLAEAATVTPRTIRFYTLEGLLPPPLRGRYALYTVEHLQRLQIIERLKKAFFPLSKIRDVLKDYTQAQVEELLATLDAEPTETTDIQFAPPTEEVTEERAPPARSAAEYIQRVLRTQKQMESPDIARRRATFREESSVGGMSPPMSPASAPAVPASIPPIPLQPAGAPETWERIALLPGVELHIRFPTTPDVREYINQVLAYANSLRKPEA